MRPLNGRPNHGLSELENAKHKTHRFYTYRGVNVISFSMHPPGPPAAASATATMVRVGPPWCELVAGGGKISYRGTVQCSKKLIPSNFLLTKSVGVAYTPIITVSSYRIDRGLSNGSRQISFEFLSIKTRPPDKINYRFRRRMVRRIQIGSSILKGGEF